MTFAQLGLPLGAWGCLLYAGLRADAQDDWGRIAVGPPHARQQVLGSFGLRNVQLTIWFPSHDPSEVLPPLQIASMPLRHLVQGPRGLRRFRPRRHGRFREASVVPKANGRRTHPWKDLEIVVMNPTEYDEKADMTWDASLYMPLLVAAKEVELTNYAALGLLTCGILIQLSWLLLARSAWLRAILHISVSANIDHRGRRTVSFLYLGAAFVVLVSSVRYVAMYRYHLGVLVSEFLIRLTDGSIAVWPYDVGVFPMTGMLLYTGGGACSLLASADLLSRAGAERLKSFLTESSKAAETNVVVLGESRKCTVVALDSNASVYAAASSAAAVAPPGGRRDSWVLQRKNSFKAAMHDGLYKQVREHNAWVIKVVIGFMVLFVVLLGIVGFVVGGKAVGAGLENAVKGADLSVRSVERSLAQARQQFLQPVRDAPGLFRNVSRSGMNWTVHAALDSQQSAKVKAELFKAATKDGMLALQAGLGAAAEAAKEQDWEEVWLIARSGVVGVLLDARRNACRSGRATWPRWQYGDVAAVARAFVLGVVFVAFCVIRTLTEF
eukprot:TRINITY_DN33921_c0_g1_i1.p1 TRINITY_DN33921_c0_g1~~TRINITY_DN33921_c0_g1_i1.p1  ORF type:complete len:553 (+),score=111.95 TRINITY_DN33921_c0_g1_i1:58-1716(+)